MTQTDSPASIGSAIETQLNWRYATKLFDRSRTISPADWEVLADSLRLSASSYGLQPWHFVIAQSGPIRNQLAVAAPLNGAKFETASHIVVIAHRKTVSAAYIDAYLKLTATTRDLPISALQEFRTMMINSMEGMSSQAQSQWTGRQAYIALGSLLTTAALLNIDACPMEGIDPDQFDRILGLAGTDYTSVVAVALGYRSPDDPLQLARKVRFPTDQVFRTV
jgi:nitroreductase